MCCCRLDVAHDRRLLTCLATHLTKKKYKYQQVETFPINVCDIKGAVECGGK